MIKVINRNPYQICIGGRSFNTGDVFEYDETIYGEIEGLDRYTEADSEPKRSRRIVMGDTDNTGR